MFRPRPGPRDRTPEKGRPSTAWQSCEGLTSRTVGPSRSTESSTLKTQLSAAPYIKTPHQPQRTAHVPQRADGDSSPSAHTGAQPPAYKGRVQSAKRRSEAQGRLDAARAGGTPHIGTGGGKADKTPCQMATSDLKGPELQGKMPPRPISPIMVDGGTAIVFRPPDGRWRPSQGFNEMVASVNAAFMETGKPRAIVPIPVPQTDLVDAQPFGTVSIVGARRETFKINIENILDAHVTMTGEQRGVRIRFRARALWAYRFGRLADYWIRAFASMLMRDHSACLVNAAEKGWHVSNVEMCGDFTGLELREEDRSNFTGMKSKDIIRQIDSTGMTLNIGTRTGSAISLCLYNKTAERKNKNKDAGSYEATWRENGWTGTEDVTRVEWRLNGHGLKFERPADDEAGTEDIDLSDPAQLADSETLQRVWRILCTKRRLIDPTTSTRRRRARTDKRWDSVRGLAGEQLEFGWRQTRRAVQVHTANDRLRRAARDAQLGIGKYLGLHGVRHVRVDDILRACVAICDVEETESIAGDTMRVHQAFLGDEIDGNRQFWEATRNDRRPMSMT